MSREKSLLNWTSALGKQCNDRKSNPFHTKNNFIWKAMACSYTEPCVDTGQGYWCRRTYEVPRGQVLFTPYFTQASVPRAKETQGGPSEWVNKESESLLVDPGHSSGLSPIATIVLPGSYSIETRMWGRSLASPNLSGCPAVRRHQRLLRRRGVDGAGRGKKRNKTYSKTVLLKSVSVYWNFLESWTMHFEEMKRFQIYI